MLPWHLWPSQVPQGLVRSSPALTSYDPNQQERFLQPSLLVLTARPAAPHLVLKLVDLNHLPASHKIIQTSQSHAPEKNQRSPHRHVTIKLTSYSAYWFTAPECSPHVALRGLQCPPRLGCEHIWLINCHQSHLSHHAFSHLRLFRAELPSITYRVTRRWSE